jgi:hypothetical protein
MAKTFDELLEYIADNIDEITIMETLELTSEDLVERFCDKIEKVKHKFEDL